MEKECYIDTNFQRHCDANDGWYTTLFDLTAEECVTACEGYEDCVVAHHHPGNQIWAEDDRTNCWLWSYKATVCDWHGAEGIKYHPGATMIRCIDSTDITGLKLTY